MSDIFQIKPNFYGVGIDLIALWKRIRRQPPSVVEKVALRFIELFEQHDVVVTQIPRLFPSIELAQLSSPASLLPALTYNSQHGGALMFRFWLLSYITPQTPLLEIARNFIGHYLANINPWTIAVTGENNIRDHVGSVGSVLLPTLLLSIAGSQVEVTPRPTTEGPPTRI